MREALMLRTGEGIPMPETAANLAVEYLDGLVWISGVPDRYTLRPYGGAPMTKDEFAEIGQGRRAHRPDRVAACHEEPFRDGDPAPCRHDRRYIALMPFILALLVDGLVRRRIREAEYHAPSPTWWTASLSLHLLRSASGWCATHASRTLSASVAFRLSRCVRPGRSDHKRPGTGSFEISLGIPRPMRCLNIGRDFLF